MTIDDLITRLKVIRKDLLAAGAKRADLSDLVDILTELESDGVEESEIDDDSDELSDEE